MKTLNDYFDKIYCINLDEAKDRWVDCLNQFKHFNIEVERFSAIKPINGNNKLNKGQLGILRSNLELIKKAKELNLSNIVILEDDFLFVNDFNDKLSDSYNKIPNNWDFIYFGGNHIGKLIKVNDNIYKMSHTYAIHSIVIKNTLYDTIISELSKEELPVDVYYANLMNRFNAYVIMPHISTQKAGYSYIENEYRNYDYCLKR